MARFEDLNEELQDVIRAARALVKATSAMTSSDESGFIFNALKSAFGMSERDQQLAYEELVRCVQKAEAVRKGGGL
jgi:hypothetical protein